MITPEITLFYTTISEAEMAKIWRLEDNENIYRYFSFNDKEKECFLYLLGTTKSPKILFVSKELIGIECVAGENIEKIDQHKDITWITNSDADKNWSVLLRLSLKSVREEIKPYLEEKLFNTDEFKEYLKEEDDIDFSSCEVQKIVKEIEISHSNLADLMIMPYWKAWFAFQWIRKNISYSILPRNSIENVARWISSLPKEKQRDPYTILCASYNLRKDYLRKIADQIYLSENVTDNFKTAICLMDQATSLWEIFSFESIHAQKASQVIRDRMGKCVGMSNVFVALCRAMGIPAMTISGYEKGEATEGNHRWASVYIAPYGWVETDPTNDKHLVAFEHEKHCFRLLPSNFWGTVRTFSREEVLLDDESMTLCRTLSAKQRNNFFGEPLEETVESPPKENLFKRLKKILF